MTDFKNIRGKRVKTFSTDLDNEQAEGQIFYSSTANQFKVAVAGAAWSSGSALITGRSRMAGCGIQTAGLGFGGYSPNTGKTEEYNGSGWSESNALNTARYNLGGCGTQTAGLGFAGYNGSTLKNESEEYNGSSWTEGDNVNTSRQMLAASGTQTAGLGFGGYTPSPAANKGETEEYNGTSWSEQNNLNTARRILAGAGTQTAGLAFGGFTDANSNSTEEYNGTSWTASNNLNTARHGLAGAGIQTSALAFGGSSNRTELYNGTSWTETGDLSTSRSYIAGCGASGPTAVAFGGNPNKSNTEEFNTSVNTVVAGAFSAGGNLNTGRKRISGGGTQTAGLAAGGFTSPPNSRKSEVEEYNGSSWTEVTNLPTAIDFAASGGTQTAFVMFAGNSGPGIRTATLEYDGSSWTSGGAMGTARYRLGGAGTQTSALGFGGYLGSPPSSGSTNTEEYDGSSWTSGGGLSTSRNYMLSNFGSQTNALAICGGSPYSNETEEYNGSSWGSGEDYLFGNRGYISGSGPSGSDFRTFGAGIASPSPRRSGESSTYDGTNYTTAPSMTVERKTAGTGAAAASNAVIAFGGEPFPGNSAATEEFTAETTSLNLKTITDS